MSDAEDSGEEGLSAAERRALREDVRKLKERLQDDVEGPRRGEARVCVQR